MPVFVDTNVFVYRFDAGCRHLVTEDLSHDQEIGGVRVVDPFQVEPGRLAP